MEINCEHNAFTKEFYALWLAKLLRTLISVKLWVLAAISYISTKLLVAGKITGTQWTTILTSGILVILFSRSVFQIASLIEEKKNGNTENAERMDE